ncbi:MAG: hypothetical protein J2P37_23475 [Ktedonobacteraceae bacterium]|nr:hypothetical protein [Ktedonobacteraceae bacterium]
MAIAAHPMRPGRTAFAQGMFWGLLAGVLQCVFTFVVGGIGGIAIGLLAVVIGLLCASIAAAWKTRSLGAGAQAGFWCGIWSGLLFIIVTLLTLFVLGNRQLLKDLYLQSLPLYTGGLTLQSFVLVGLLSAGYIFIAALLGGIIGAIGSIFGRIVPRRV